MCPWKWGNSTDSGGVRGQWACPGIQLTLSVTKYVKLKAIKSESHVRNVTAITWMENSRSGN